MESNPPKPALTRKPGTRHSRTLPAQTARNPLPEVDPMSEPQRSAIRLPAEIVFRWMGRAFFLGLFVGAAAAINALAG